MAKTYSNRAKDKQEVKAITDQLEEGLKELFESEKYKRYLSMMSKFHNYSANNIQLITMQCPDATFVAGRKAWENEFNRQVNRGEGGIRILAPAPYTIKKEQDKVDPVTGEVMLDRDGMPEKEEIQIRIPAFRVVRVFDVSQTDGEPLPELETEELLSTVEGYEDFIKAVSFVAPVPVSFEDIPGDPAGFFSHTEKRIAVQEGMSESQTLKTLVHETAHAILHDKDVNKEDPVPAKDRNTREVEAESIAYTVCKHFGIDTSEYSFGYIAGWSSGKGMKELKSSLDTIRRTASRLITGIEAQLFELERDRELMKEQEKESLLLIQNRDLTQYSLLSVSGMDAAELVEALSAMKDDDRLDIAEYLDNMGAWTTEIANEETREFGEYHLDVRYYTDTNEVINLKAEMEFNERAKEPIGADDVILKIAFADGFEVERITNKTPEEVQEIMAALTKLEEKNTKEIRGCLESYGVDYIPISVSGGRNSGMPQFNDFEIDLDKKEVVMMHHLSPAQQAEGIINRLEYAKTAFSDDERSLIVNHAHKLNDIEKTRELAERIYYEETEGNQGAALAVIDAQAEIDALPDPMIGLSEMEEYGYTWEEMLPLTKETALELFDRDLPVYRLHEDGTETMAEEREQITGHEGIFGIEKADWEIEKSLRALQKELTESRANKEAQLLYGSTDKYGIYQLKDDPELRHLHFEGTESLKKMGIIKDNLDAVKPENYNLIYTGELSGLSAEYGFLPTREDKLETIYEKLNIDRPADFKGHSLSVSDVVVLHINGKNSAHFVDSFGFTGLPDFMRKLEGVKEQETETYPPLYRQPITYAAEHGEKDAYRRSWELNQECKRAVEEAISQNFDGMHLDKDAVKPVLEEYGAERLSFILANTLKQEEWDARFSRDNVAWATEFFNSENMDYGAEGNVYLSLGSHPAVLDGFIDMFRREVLEQEKELSAGQERLTSGHGVQKPEPEQAQSEQPEPEQAEQSEAAQPEPEQAEQSKPEQPSETPDEDMDGDEIIDLGDEREQVLAEMKQSLGGSKDASGQNVQKPETELAFQIADRFISIHETDEGYDYSIMGEDYKVIDGGVYDNPDVSIREALNDIVEDLKENPFDNGARGNIRDSDELIPIDHEELMEKVEEADRIEPQEDVVADFRKKTNELFHKNGRLNPAEIEETVKCYVQAQIDETGIGAKIVDAVVVGSRCRGLEQEGSDLDVVVELSTNEREDVLFDMFHGDGFRIGGMDVDINPITAQRTGTLETYLPQAEEYLEGMREARDKEAAALSPEQPETEVTLTVAECGEFHNLGEFYENIPTVEEAVAIWKQIPPERMNGIPAIGIHLHTPGTEPIEDTGIDILCGRRIDLDILEYIPEIKGNPQAMEVIAEFVAKVTPLIPDMEIDGVMSEKLEAQVWEKRMPDLTPLEQFAVEIDRFIYDHDTDLYRDNVPNMTEGVSEIAEALKQRDTRDIALWLTDIAADGAVPEERKRALGLLEKLPEYKPLAKIEEMEEQNYNMVDNVPNNGAGEKAQKEENRKAQDKPAAKPSLKARLAEKKAQVAGQGREPEENQKNKQREM